MSYPQGIFETLAWLTKKYKQLCCAIDQLRLSGAGSYRVYTALLTQSGGSVPLDQTNGTLTVGVSYQIDTYQEGDDFLNVGGPAAAVGGAWDGYWFVATGTTPSNYSNGSLLAYNTGAPVVTVLENTIGNVWFRYGGVGNYSIYSDGLFTENKTTFSIILMGDDLSNEYLCKGYIQEPNSCGIVTGDISTYYDNILNWKTPIEIRVYN